MNKFAKARLEWETAFIKFNLQSNAWNVSATATSLGMDRSSLHGAIRRLKLKRPEAATPRRIDAEAPAVYSSGVDASTREEAHGTAVGL